MMMTCDEARMSLGVYVLGALDPQERAEVEAHLDGCPGCRAELEELTGVAGFLDRVSEEDVAHAASPPHAVLDRLLNARVRRRRLTRVLLSLAASVVLVGLGGTIWATASRNAEVTSAASAPEPASPEAAQDAPGGRDAPAEVQADRKAAPSASATSGDQAMLSGPVELVRKGSKGTVRATVTAVPGEKTTDLRLKLSGVATGTRFRLEVIGLGGERQTAGNWTVDKSAYEESGGFTGTTTIPPGNIERFEVVTDAGRVLVDVSTPGR
ncbi:anti-sigma factor family protein [Planobispora takensis]|uniref:Putative zinc-finger domain-containing protein n=1 Tax=Planobispora takensis TaxID=1367882 RepID=A0A8J3T8R1_9ACTN|nr:zf-HC2 domain-containing protein [Planobispora takensis]GII02989.1 hypothetical protein Pta02_49970 [Planobispora takensis]